MVTSQIILCDDTAFEEIHLLLKAIEGHLQMKMNAEKHLCKLPNGQRFLPGAGHWENAKESKVIPALQEPDLNYSITTAVFLFAFAN